MLRVVLHSPALFLDWSQTSIIFADNLDSGTNCQLLSILINLVIDINIYFAGLTFFCELYSDCVQKLIPANASWKSLQYCRLLNQWHDTKNTYLPITLTFPSFLFLYLDLNNSAGYYMFLMKVKSFCWKQSISNCCSFVYSVASAQIRDAGTSTVQYS